MVKEDLHLFTNLVAYLSHYVFTFLIDTVHPESMTSLAAEKMCFAEEGEVRLLRFLNL